jgi:rhodanese-related sulfurtransferase
MPASLSYTRGGVKSKSVRSVRQAIVILFAALVPAVLVAAFHPRRPALSEEQRGLPGEERLETVLGWGKTVLWLDARSAKEYNAEHLPGAILLNLEDWDTLFPSFLEQWEPDEKVVVYCSSTACQLSHEVAQRLKQSGISQVFVLKGGWEAWKSKQ